MSIKTPKRFASIGSRGFSLIEMMVVVIIVGILVGIATIRTDNSRKKAHVAAMKSDLRNLIPQQEAYYEEQLQSGTGKYAKNVGQLGFNPSAGVKIKMKGNKNGWSARATSQVAKGVKCAVFKGSINPYDPATQEGRVECS